VGLGRENHYRRRRERGREIGMRMRMISGLLNRVSLEDDSMGKERRRK
jgi:hypothetical protein